MTKALAILKEGLDFMNQAIKVNPNSVKELQSEIDRYVEAIKELEELNNRSCEGCKFGKFGVNSIGVDVECSLNWKCSRGYSDKFEAKGE